MTKPSWPVRSRQQGTAPRALTPAQLAAVDLVVLGKPDAEVAAAVGVTRQTVWGWRHYSAEFRASLNARRREVFGQAGDRLRVLLGKALGVLEAELDSKEWSEEKVKVALKLLDYAGGPVLANQVAPAGPEDGDAVLVAEAGRRHHDDMSRMLGGAGPDDTAALRREWAERLTELEEATDGDEATEDDAGAR